MKHSSTPWWRTDVYDGEYATPAELDELAGPHGVALVRAWPDGRTDAGWGGDTFMAKYEQGGFNARRVLYGYNAGKWAFAFIMRSVRLVCIDIDGKNGGLEHAKKLGMLPPTLAETSKSGDGYHLFYTVDEEWVETKGYALLGDRIGLEQGVDFRATGCVYHHPQQRWNDRAPVPLPDHLFQLLHSRNQKVAASNARIVAILEGDDQMEIMMMQDELLSELKKPIPAGKRNNTLFAIGSQMKLAGITGWEEPLSDRANELGLDTGEIEKLVSNIEKYAVPVP